MGTPKKVWFTGEAGQLRCEVNGLLLCVERSTTVGFIVFAVLTPADARTRSCVLVSGIERSALCAMSAAEAAAAVLAPWPGAMIVRDDGYLPPPVSAQAKRSRMAVGHGIAGGASGPDGILLSQAGAARVRPVPAPARHLSAHAPDPSRGDETNRR